MAGKKGQSGPPGNANAFRHGLPTLKTINGSIIEKARMMTDDERVRILSEAKPNTWLALSSDETKIVGRGDSYSEAVEDALNHGESDPLLIKVPDNWEPRVFHLCA